MTRNCLEIVLKPIHCKVPVSFPKNCTSLIIDPAHNSNQRPHVRAPPRPSRRFGRGSVGGDGGRRSPELLAVQYLFHAHVGYEHYARERVREATAVYFEWLAQKETRDYDRRQRLLGLARFYRSLAGIIPGMPAGY